MTVYETKPKRVDAWQWLPDDPRMVGEVIAALLKFDVEFHIEHDVQTKLTIRPTVDAQNVPDGAWIVRDADGQISVWGPETFLTAHEAPSAVEGMPS